MCPSYPKVQQHGCGSSRPACRFRISLPAEATVVSLALTIPSVEYPDKHNALEIAAATSKEGKMSASHIYRLQPNRVRSNVLPLSTNPGKQNGVDNFLHLHQ